MPIPVPKETARWQAVSSRSPVADGEFYYAVRTTGVFCRPTCASRKPRRENVEYFDTAEDAIRAGYRACKRCRPTTEVSERSATLIEACRLLSGLEPMSNRHVARSVGLSESYFQRSFKKHFGVTPQQYRRRVLAERARRSLGRTRSVTESIYEAGYSTSSRFYEGVGRELGMKPATAKAGAPGETIRYCVAPCSLGRVLIAWTARGVCQVAFADSADEVVDELHRRFPKAALEPSSHSDWARAVVESVEMATPADVPLDVRGTAFQERVWRHLREISAGQTQTYGEVAVALGRPTAARAVARACASNPVAVVIPCHRVVRRDGSVAGYRWGEARKKELLRRESR